MKKKYFLILFLSIPFLFSISCKAEVIHLKDGSIIRGKVVEKKNLIL